MKTQRKGQSLVEFALVALVLYLLFGAIFTFGHTLFVAQQVQMSADLLAREISRQPMSISKESLDDALTDLETADDEFVSSIFDRRLLIYDVPEGDNLEDVLETAEGWPIVNRMLCTVMLYDGTTFQIPGARRRTIGDVERIQIAKVFNPESDADWVDVVEELLDDEDESVFPPGSDPEDGVVALRINYPVHSPFFTAMYPPADGTPLGDPNVNPIHVDDPATEFSELGAAPNYLDPSKNLYGGELGLGRQYAWGSQVRPFRRIVSGQAIYRREVFTTP